MLPRKEVVVGWFLSLKESLQKQVMFIPNMLSSTKEQRAGIKEIESIIADEGRGKLLTGLSDRKAVYPPLLNGSQTNFFQTKIDPNTQKETSLLFGEITKDLIG